MLLCALFTALTAVGAFIKIPVPVCPFTLQFLFTNLAGLLLGSRLGAISVGVYVVLGLAGLPIFASGGGIGYIFSPTFGYILGFLLGAWAAGKIREKLAPKFRSFLIAGFANLFIVYALGMGYYYFISNFYLKGTGIGVWALFLYCFLLAVPGDICLCILGAVLGKRILPIIGRAK